MDHFKIVRRLTFELGYGRALEVKLLELSVDCKATGGWDSRISHLKVSYDQVHKISSSLVLGILYCHKLPLF